MEGGFSEYKGALGFFRGGTITIGFELTFGGGGG